MCIRDRPTRASARAQCTAPHGRPCARSSPPLQAPGGSLCRLGSRMVRRRIARPVSGLRPELGVPDLL
eukprot:9325548-Alexandrium_andersonii.AAC.1